MKNDPILNALEACLQSETVSPALHSRILTRAALSRPARYIVPPRRLIVAAVCILLLVTTAAAITIAELVRRDMKPVEQIYIDHALDGWGLEEKLRYVSLMETLHLALDEGRLAALYSGQLTTEEQEQLAGELIWDCIARHRQTLHAQPVDPANAPEPYPLPGQADLFEMLWLMHDPEASPEVIAREYALWAASFRDAYHAAAPAATPVPVLPEDELARAAILDTISGYMADAMSMSHREREAASVTADFHPQAQAWLVIIRVKGSEVRDVTRRWFDARRGDDVIYDSAADTYTFSIVFTAEGRVGDAASIEEYEWQHLIPREAWPDMPSKYGDYPYFDPFKQFRLSSAADKAAVCQQWKPVADRWLRAHPDFHARLKAANPHDPYYLVTRHQYSVPPQDFVQESDALRIAILHAITLQPDVTADQLMNRYYQALFYDVCDPENPLWKVHLTPDPDNILPGDPMVDFMVIIDPTTGNVLQDQDTLPCGAATQW